MYLKPIFTAAVVGLLSTAGVAEMKAELADATWDGKSIPTAERCKRFGGEGKTPRLHIQGVPTAANALIVSFSDRTYRQMDNGGHGRIGFNVEEGATDVTLPTVPGHSFDLPSGTFIVTPHRAPSWDVAGAFLPPCSGGGGNQYYATIEAVKLGADAFQILDETNVELGVY